MVNYKWKKKISDEYINLTNTLKKKVCKNHLFKLKTIYVLTILG